MRNAARFYRLWLGGTFKRAPHSSDLYVGLVGSAIGVAEHYRPKVGEVTGDWVWQVPLWAFGAILIVRFLATPFILWRDNNHALEDFRAQLAINRERAFHAVRYVNLLARKVEIGQRPPLDAAAFVTCIRGVDDALTSRIPKPIFEAFSDLRYVINRAHELLLNKKKGALTEMIGVAERGQAQLDAIDEYIAKVS